MAQFLQERMTRAYHALKAEQRLPFQTTLLKTYLMECHRCEKGDHQEIHKVLREDVAQTLKAAGSDAQVRETAEERFFLLEVMWGDREKPVTLYLDASDPRFWVAHSVDESTAADWVHDRIVGGSCCVDAAWLPAELLEYAAGLGDFRGLGLDYDRREVPDVDFEAPEAPIAFLKMQLWGNRAADILKVLRSEKGFPQATTLSKVKVRYALNGRSDEFSLDDLKYNGKLAARGTSFQTHVLFATTIYRKYATRVRELQESLPLRSERSHSRVRLRGVPVNVTFPNLIGDMDKFCDSLFASAAPFRLWGLPVRVSDTYTRVAAVDLHAGGAMDFEIFPRYMRVYLRDGCCANSMLRLYTNLQHYYDGQTEARLGNGQCLSQF
jgi:hypothetical protein